MKDGFIKSMALNLLGDNTLLRMIVARYTSKRQYVKAAGLVLYLLPLRSIVKASEIFKRYRIMTDKNYYDELQNLLRIAKVEDSKLVRIGRDHDGGYVMPNKFLGGVAYSFGICDDVSWDKDMVSHGYEVFMYDHTIKNLPEENPHFHFFRQGISDGKTNDERLLSLEHFIKVNHHENERNMILKMDVEGAEWGFLSEVSTETLSQFSQIVFEFHDMNNPNDKALTLEALRKLKLTHELVHVHANNNSDYHVHSGKIFADVIEVTYVRRDSFVLSEDYDVNLPLSIDQTCNDIFPEIEIGCWNKYVVLDDCAEVVINALRHV